MFQEQTLATPTKITKKDKLIFKKISDGSYNFNNVFL